mmetsp:Transcript_17354/g.29035  ORF Transcript_17354/g.29035 Transcript_17354/m.29035 type:complete len:220 (-) Transcript_17354:626-1285(-)
MSPVLFHRFVLVWQLHHLVRGSAERHVLVCLDLSAVAHLHHLSRLHHNAVHVHDVLAAFGGRASGFLAGQSVHRLERAAMRGARHHRPPFTDLMLIPEKLQGVLHIAQELHPDVEALVGALAAHINAALAVAGRCASVVRIPGAHVVEQHLHGLARNTPRPHLQLLLRYHQHRLPRPLVKERLISSDVRDGECVVSLEDVLHSKVEATGLAGRARLVGA